MLNGTSPSDGTRGRNLGHFFLPDGVDVSRDTTVVVSTARSNGEHQEVPSTQLRRERLRVLMGARLSALGIVRAAATNALQNAQAGRALSDGNGAQGRAWRVCGTGQGSEVRGDCGGLV